ncbi:MAG: hypothetical protein ACI4OM_02695 [Evtepia sp.]
MSVIELLLTAIALSMDAMAVSVSSSLSAKKVSIRNALLMALFFLVFFPPFLQRNGAPAGQAEKPLPKASRNKQSCAAEPISAAQLCCL